jgi:hypothetical protein
MCNFSGENLFEIENFIEGQNSLLIWNQNFVSLYIKIRHLQDEIKKERKQRVLEEEEKDIMKY